MKRGWSTGLLALGVVVAALLSLVVGSVHLPAGHLLAALHDPGPSLERTILLELRLPRVLLAIVAGAALAGAGTAYQGLFRNPLADPFVIGASSGAALGAAVAILYGPATASVVTVAAFLGALGAVGVVFLLGGVGPASSPLSLLLAGVAVSTVAGALVALLMILRDRGLAVVFHWLLGDLGGAGWREVAYGGPLVLAGLAVLQLLARPLDALTLGEETVRNLGMSVGGFRLAIVAASTLVTAAAVSMVGIIGFVGLLAPHAARLLVGLRHGRLLPASCLLGALLLLLADDAARTLAAPQEIPVSLVTALLGGPFFLYLLRRRIGVTGGSS